MIPPVTDGKEQLILEVEWVARRRDRFTVHYIPVHSPPRMEASGGSPAVALYAIAEFLGYALERTDNGYLLKER